MNDVPSRPRLFSGLRSALRRASLMRRLRSLDPALAAAAAPSLPSTPVRLACMAIIRGEDDYLVEWLEFHRLMGVDHFVIYDNGVEPSTAQLLRPYVEARIVTHLPFPDPDWPELKAHVDEVGQPSIQELAYAHCVTRMLDRALHWVKLDVDEFMYPAQAAHETITDVLDTLDRALVCGIEVTRLEFGHNEHMRRTEGLVIERFTRCGESESKKTLGNSAFIERSFASADAHRFTYRVPVPLRLIRGFRPQLRTGAEASALLRVNHYFCKSLDEYLHKGELNATGYMAAKESKASFYVRNRGADAHANTDILRFLPQLKARLAARAASLAPEATDVSSEVGPVS